MSHCSQNVSCSLRPDCPLVLRPHHTAHFGVATAQPPYLLAAWLTASWITQAASDDDGDDGDGDVTQLVTWGLNKGGQRSAEL
jgi:hypothetical protein